MKKTEPEPHGTTLVPGFWKALHAWLGEPTIKSRNPCLIGTAISGGKIARHPRDRASGNVK